MTVSIVRTVLHCVLYLDHNKHIQGHINVYNCTSAWFCKLSTKLIPSSEICFHTTTQNVFKFFLNPYISFMCQMQIALTVIFEKELRCTYANMDQNQKRGWGSRVVNKYPKDPPKKPKCWVYWREGPYEGQNKHNKRGVYSEFLI